MSDVELQASEGGLGQVVVDGADVTDFVRGIGVDVEAGRGTRVVLEGGASLRAFLEGVDVEVRAIPAVRPDELELLRRAVEGWDPEDDHDRDRARRALEALGEVVG